MSLIHGEHLVPLHRKNEFGRGLRRSTLFVRAADGIDQKPLEALLSRWTRSREAVFKKGLTKPLDDLDELDEPHLLAIAGWDYAGRKPVEDSSEEVRS